MMTNRTTRYQMHDSLVPHKRGETVYFLKGNNPKLLLLSGMHGDEYEVSECLTAYVRSHAHELPDFVFIPQASPSAVRRKTRQNAYGRDINRSFAAPIVDEEAKTLMDILHGDRFTLSLDFHEDSDRYKSFYCYDSGQILDAVREKLEHAVQTAGFSLYSGIDDEADANLGLTIRQGYISTPLSSMTPYAGFLSQRLLTEGIARRTFTLEIPGKADTAKKGNLVANLMPFFMSLLYDKSLEATS